MSNSGCETVWRLCASSPVLLVGGACVYSLPPLAPFPSPLTRVHMPHKSPLLPSPPPLQDQPQAVRDKLEALLNSQSIPFSYSKVSKFANFIKKSLL